MPNSELLSRAAKNFFAKSGQLCPEAMVYELHHLKENLPLISANHQPIQDLQSTLKLLDTIIDFIHECKEIKKG